MVDVYKNCPEYENEDYLVRMVCQEDRMDLLKVYSDKRVLSDVWVNPLFSFCLTKPIWWLIANQKIREYPKYRKNR